jgi:hypothetical protein
MSGASSELKVLKAVVSLVAVDVVNVVVGSESAPNMALHEQTVLQYVEAAPSELNVAVPSDSSGDMPVAARARAETHISSGCS